MKVQLAGVRIAFATLFDPKRGGDAEEKRFSAAFPIEPGSANAKLLEDAVQAVATEKWGKKAAAIVAELRKTKKVCYVHDALKGDDGETYDGFEGMHSVNAGQGESKGKPLVIDRDRTRLESKDGRPYSGCYVNALIDIWAQDNQYGKRINAQLKGVQFVKDGDAFGGGAPAKPDEFEDLGVPEETESALV
jgi:ssDNA-binding protein